MDNKSVENSGAPGPQRSVSPKVRLRRKDREQHAYNRHSFIVESNGGGGGGQSPDSVTHLYNPYNKKHVSTTSLVGGGIFPRCGVPAKVMRSDLDRDTFLNNRRSMDLSDLEKLRFQSSTYKHDSNNFWKSFGKAMVFVQLAVKSLDSLNEQLMQYIFSPKPADDNDELSPKDRETLKSSIVLLRELLMDAQNKFSKLVEDNKRLTTKIDSAVLAANEEVNTLRAELFDTNRKLSEIQECPTPEEFPKKAVIDNDVAVQHKMNQNAEEIRLLNNENKRLNADLARLKEELVELKESNKSLIASDDGKANEIKLDFIQTKQELNRAREALTAMKADRKRLKAEKIDLLHQMKQLYCTLEDKESELRDFIRNYEQKMTESDDGIKQLAAEKEECEREKWEILKKAKESTERAFALKSELDQKDESIRKLSTEVTEAYDMLRQLGHLKTVSSASEDSVLKPSSLDGHQSIDSHDELPPYEGTPESSEPPSIRSSFRSSISVIQSTSTPNRSTTFSTPNLHVPSPGSHSTSVENLQQSINNEGIYVTIASDMNINRSESSQSLNRKKKKTSASFSRLFSGKSRSRKSVNISEPERLHVSSNPRMSALTPDNYQEKLGILDEAKHSNMSTWKAGHVLAWMEIEMNMPMYAKPCLENIKSGKVLLGLSDAELDSALGLTSPLHRRKLRLAIEEFRDPTIVKYAKAPRIDHTWIAHRWMVDLGLPQYSSAFDAQLLDGRILNVLTRKDLEKHLSVHRKFHQASVLHGIELLRRVNFDKEVLAERRSRCEDQDCDPLVWTSARVTKWVNSIDLQEYAHNLRESGVHGAVLVLEPTFDAGALATALGIPPSKSYVRRHLSTELDAIIRPARLALEVSNGPKRRPHTAGGSVGPSFTRSYRGGNSDNDSRGSGRKLSFRGSLGRALSRKHKQALLATQDDSNA